MAAVDTAGHRIRVLWRGPSRRPAGSPVIGGGAVWVTDWDAGVSLPARPGHRARPPADRPRLAARRISPRPRCPEPFALIGTMSGVTAVAGA